MQQWPEGPVADPKAARERYTSDSRASRNALREAVRADLPVAHGGLGIVVVASALLSLFTGPVAGALVAGAFAALFLAAPAVMLLRDTRGLDATRRAYLFSFGWANWIQALRCRRSKAADRTRAGPPRTGLVHECGRQLFTVSGGGWIGAGSMFARTGGT